MNGSQKAQGKKAKGYTGDLARLVVTSQNRNLRWIPIILIVPVPFEKPSYLTLRQIKSSKVSIE